MRDISFGQYYPTNSPIHRLDPRAKLIFTLLYMVFIFFVNSYTTYLLVAVFLLSTTLLAKVPVKALFKSIKAITFLILLTMILNLVMYKKGTVLAEWWIFTITDIGIDNAFKLAFRLIFLIMGTSLLTFTTTPMELTDGIESLLKPLKYIKVPVHDIAMTMSIALRFIPSLMDETDKIIMAQKARGSAIDNGKFHEKIKSLVPILIPLFVSAFRRADELSDALDARCYNATKNRTKMKKLSFRLQDLIALFVLLAVIAFIMVDKYYFGIHAGSIATGADYYIYEFFKGLLV